MINLNNSINNTNNASILAFHDQRIRDNNQRLINEWQRWANNALSGNEENRQVAVERLKHYLEHHSVKLDLSYLNLSELPEHLPASLRELDISYNMLVCLPDNLPSFLKVLHLNNNPLTNFPDNLPYSLEKLYISDALLNALPYMLREAISGDINGQLPVVLLQGPLLNSVIDSRNNRSPIESYFNHERMEPIELTTRESPSIDIMQSEIERQQFEIWQNEIEKKEQDHIQDRYINWLMDPDGTSLFVEEFDEIDELQRREQGDVRNTFAEEQPQRQTLEQSATREQLLLDLHNNRRPLSEVVDELGRLDQQLLLMRYQAQAVNDIPQEATRRAGMDRVDSMWSLMDLKYLKETINLTEQIKNWSKNADVTQWKKIQSEEHANVFAEFLQKLHQGKNVGNKMLHKEITNWLKYLAKDKNSQIRKQTFLIAHEATENCVDRASFYFNKMYTLMIEDKLIKKEVPISQLIQTNRQLFRLQILEKIAAQHADKRRRHASGFAEDIEIYLAYQYKLRNKLSLPIHTKLQYGLTADLTTGDLERAEKQVLEKEKNDFFRYLVTESTSWIAQLERWNNTKKTATDDSYLEEIASEDFTRAVDDLLKVNNITVDDDDARQAASKKMADDLLYKKRYKLTQEFLAENNALALLNSDKQIVAKKKGLVTTILNRFR